MLIAPAGTLAGSPAAAAAPFAMTAEKLSTREILRRNLQRKPPAGMGQLRLMLHDVRSMHNVGAAFRSADAFGVLELLLTGFTPVPPRPEITKTALGADEHVDWRRFEETGEAVTLLREEQSLLVAFEQTDRSVAMPELELPAGRPVCLLFGNEVEGIPPTLLEEADRLVEIPQYGHKHSLNVSVTVGIALYGILSLCWEHD
ncbi:MAG: TrmH family RNA methyltransferase [Balneolaceae bacterium]|nr:TrmH family RNA methyltransferase [Balneolaceae bacterium]